MPCCGDGRRSRKMCVCALMWMCIWITQVRRRAHSTSSRSRCRNMHSPCLVLPMHRQRSHKNTSQSQSVKATCIRANQWLRNPHTTSTFRSMALVTNTSASQGRVDPQQHHGKLFVIERSCPHLPLELLHLPLALCGCSLHLVKRGLCRTVLLLQSTSAHVS